MVYYTPYTSSIIREMSLLSLLQSSSERSFASPIKPMCASHEHLEEMPDFSLPPSICSLVEYFKHYPNELAVDLIPMMQKRGLNDAMISEVLAYRKKHITLSYNPINVLRHVRQARKKASMKMLNSP